MAFLLVFGLGHRRFSPSPVLSLRSCHGLSPAVSARPSGDRHIPIVQRPLTSNFEPLTEKSFTFSCIYQKFSVPLQSQRFENLSLIPAA